MAYFFSPIGNSQVVDANGDPLVGGTISTYLAGTTTAETTYTDDTGGTPQGVVMTLNSLGYPTNGPVWMLGGQPLKFIIKNALGVTQSTFDDVSGIGDTAVAVDQWTLYGATPTYISATSFSVAGDQTNTFQAKRKLESVNAGGTVYSTITSSSFGAGITTVIVSNTSGVLDAGMSLVRYGFLSTLNDSIPTSIARADGSNITALPALTTPVSLIALRSYLSGCAMSTAGSSATMSIAAGAAMDSTNAYLMQLSAIAKTTSAWAVGTAAGGLDAGAIANSTWYHFYAIRRPDTGVVDVIFSTSASAPTLPANYTQYRRIGSGKTNGSAQWTKFVQRGNTFLWDTFVADASGNAPLAATLVTTTIPTGLEMEGIYSVNLGNVGLVTLMVTSPLVADQGPSASLWTAIGAGAYAQGNEIRVFTNTSAQVRVKGDNANPYRLYTLGWVDTRGRDA